MAPKKARTGDVAGSSGTTRKRASAGSSSNRSIVFKNASQRKRYESLKKRPIVPTRYPPFNDNTLSYLGIESNVIMLLNNLGWMNFLNPSWNTYEELTLEFLSSICFAEDRTNIENPNHRLSFRLFNCDFDLSLTEFAEVLGFKNEGLIHDSKNPVLRPEGFDEDAFWALITGEECYGPRTAKASRIHNPVFRYIHRIMACTIFGRGETGGVRTVELFILWAMVHSHPVNTCYYLVSNLAHLAEHGKGVTAVGGMISFIVDKLGLGENFEHFKGIGELKIDYEFCVNMQMVQQVKRGLNVPSYLLISRQRSIQLPNKERTDITNPATWLFPIAAGVNQPIENEQVQEEQEPAEQDGQNAPNNHNFNLEAWCARMETEQARQKAELQLIREDQLLHGQQMEHVSDMLQTLMQHFNINHAPPPGQQ